MTSKSERSESAGSESANSPIKIEVFVEPVAGDGSSTNGKNGNSKVMSGKNSQQFFYSDGPVSNYIRS